LRQKVGVRAASLDVGLLRALRRKWLAGPVTDMQHRDHTVVLVNRLDDSIDVPSMAAQQMPETAVLRGHRTSGGVFVEAENRRFQSFEPRTSLSRTSGIDIAVDTLEVPDRAGRQFNAVCHTRREAR